MVYTDSIRKNLSPDSVISEIKLLLNNPKAKHSTIIIFEGYDDIALFKTLLNDNVYQFESYGGKTALHKIIEVYKAERRVIAIRDKDYDCKSYKKIFYYDHCNLETMLISNDEFFSNTLSKLTLLDHNFIVLRDEILEKLANLSALRKLNEEKVWGLDLSKLVISQIVSPYKNFTLKGLVDFVNKKTKKIAINSYQEKLVETEAYRIKHGNLLDFTNGHDFCEALYLYLKAKYGETTGVKNLGIKSINIVLRLGYNLVFFKSTNLYKSIELYENENNFAILKKYDIINHYTES